MKQPKNSYISLSLFVFFIGLFYVWSYREDLVESFHDFRLKEKSVRTKFQSDDGAKVLRGAIPPLLNLKTEYVAKINDEMSSIEKDLFLQIDEHMQEIEQEAARCQAQIGSYYNDFEKRRYADFFDPNGSDVWDSQERLFYPILIFLENSLANNISKQIHDFLMGNISANPQELYAIYSHLISTCINPKLISILSEGINYSIKNNWSTRQKIAISKVLNPLYNLMSEIPSHSNVLLFLSFLDSLQVAEAIHISDAYEIEDLRERTGRLYIDFAQSFFDESLSSQEKGHVLRSYLIDERSIAQEVTSFYLDKVKFLSEDNI